MKYIRTKEGIYIQCKLKGYENCYCLPSNTNITKKEDLVIFKQADNLKELCDEFVFNETLIYDETEMKWLVSQGCEVYGCIWTSKGLIYVAKMKGVLLPNGEIDWQLL